MDSLLLQRKFYSFATEKESLEGWLEGGGDQETNTNFLRKKIVSDQFVLPCNVMRQKYRGTKDEIQITCL